MPASDRQDPRIALEQPSTTAIIVFALLAVALPLGVLVAALWEELVVRAQGHALPGIGGEPALLLLAVGATALLTFAAWWLVQRRLRRHHLVVHGDALEVTTTFHHRVIPLSELDLAAARVADLGERTELKPVLKTNGTSLPGLRSGWFRLRNRRKALVATAGGPRVLWLPTHGDFDLLLQPRQPQALLDHLRELAAARRRS
jgi:hypothetical protein